MHPLRRDIPIYLGAEGPKNVALAAEICDGWLAWLFSPRHDAMYRGFLDRGLRPPRCSAQPSTNFEVVASTILVPGNDVDACADFVRPVISLYVGGMGAKGANFHRAVFDRMGYESQCDTIQDLYLAGDKAAATAAVTTRDVRGDRADRAVAQDRRGPGGLAVVSGDPRCWSAAIPPPWSASRRWPADPD